MKILIYMLCLLPFLPLHADLADVLEVRVNCSRTCSFDVTLEHADSGWEHYADQWDVVAPDGSVLGSRVLYHPHVNEQPFTRSLSGVRIPPQVTSVTIRARDSRHGFGGVEKSVALPERH